MVIYFVTLIHLAINKLVVDTQTQISGILFFNNQQQKIHVWIRPQPQFKQEEQNYNPSILFAIIKDENGQNLLKFSYYINDKVIMIFFEKQFETIYSPVFEFQDPLDITWMRFVIEKSKENIENIYVSGGHEVVMKLNKANMIYSWQSKLFSCNIYDQSEQFKERFLIIQNDIFIKQQVLSIFNYRILIILQIYIKFQKNQNNLVLVHIQDQNYWDIKIRLNLTNIMIDYNFSYYKSFSNAFDSNITNQWIQISFFTELDHIKCQLAFKEKFYEQIVQYIYDVQDGMVSSQILFLPKTIEVSPYLQNYKIFIVNKFVDTQIVHLDNFCFQNCKICNKLQCLECEGQLSLVDNCQCPVNQDVDLILGKCVDITLTQNIKVNHSFNIKFCPFGQYYDSENLKCTECPKLNEFNCTSCIYNNDNWQPRNFCQFQDLFQQIFIQTGISKQFRKQLLNPGRIDLYPNYILSSLSPQRLFLVSRDIYFIMFELCEKNYFQDQKVYKCKILQKGQQYGVYLDENYFSICKIGYVYLNKCIKCQKNCLFCKYVNYKLICILPNQSYTLGQNKQIIKCLDNKCQEIDHQGYDKCQIEYCQVCYFASCLVCKDKYVNDYEGFCHFGSQYSAYLKFEVNNNLIKPQYDYQQIFYIRYQLKKFEIDLNYCNILQLMIFGNNHKAMRQDQLPQQQNNIYSNDNQQVYCLNQTQHFGKRFCHQPVPGYQYNQYLDKYVYCYNQNCSFDQIYKVIILYSNQPSIQYKNMTFKNFEFFAQSLSINDLFIQNIIIEAIVYVFDTFQNNCDSNFFVISNKNRYNYQVVLDFQGVSVFANCYNILLIDFNEVSILNLFTYTELFMKFICDKVLIKNCTFYNQETILLKIESPYIYLEQIYIQGILKEQNKSLIAFQHPNLIKYFLIIDLYIGNVSLYKTNLISIGSKVNLAKMEYISIKYNQFRESSKFLRAYQTINLIINFLIVDNMLFERSGLVVFVFEQIPNQVTINNLFISQSQIKNSLLIQSYRINLVNVAFINLYIEDSNLIAVSEDLTMQNITFYDLQLILTQIIHCDVKLIYVYQFYIIQSLIAYSKSLIQISTPSFSFKNIQVTKCCYIPNFMLINISGKNGIISSLLISKVTNCTNGNQANFDNNQILDMIVLYADRIQIQKFYFVDLLNPQPLLNIKYNKLLINKIYLRKIEFKKKFNQEQLNIIKPLILIESIQNQNSICFIQNFKANQIYIVNYPFDHLYQLNNLAIISVFHGQVNINQLIINNLLSDSQLYILKAYQIRIRIESIQINDIQNVGLLYFSSSQVNCNDIFYNTTYLYNIRVPLVKNDELLSGNNIITLKDLKFNNLIHLSLIQKLIPLQKLLQLIQKLKKLSISGLGYVAVSYIQISDQQSYNQQSDNQQYYYFLSENNLQIKIQYISINNVNMGVYKSKNNQDFYGNNLIILNGIMNQSLFQFSNYSGEISFQNMRISNITLQKNTIIKLNISNHSNIFQHRIIFHAIIIIQYNGESFINYILNYQEEAQIALKDIRIEQSYFSNSIFYFNSIYPLKFDIQGLQIYKVNCGIFFFSRFNNILIKKSVILDLYQRENQGTNEIQFIFSNLYQTNILYQEAHKNQDNDQNKPQINDLYPIQLSFHGNQFFKIILNKHQILQVEYSKENNIVYVPSGQQFKNFQYFNLQNLAHEQIYRNFTIKINSRAFSYNQQILCNLKQSVDGNHVGKYSNYQKFYLQDGLNTFYDFVFIMNPYQNYSFLQNDIICNNYTLRFDVRILPCQLGEYIYQNECITCDINKNLYSIINRAQYCQILNLQQISEIKVGKIKLNQNYWRPSLTSNLIEKCETDQVCRGGWLNGDLSCHSSRVGAICKECDKYNLKGEGQFVQSGQKCLECQPNLLLLLKGFCIFLWIILITFMNYNTSKKIAEKFLQFKVINRIYSDILMRQSIDQFSIIIKIYTNYIFIMYLVQENLQFLDNNIILALNFIINPGAIITTELDCILVKIINLDIQYIQLASSLIGPIITIMTVFFFYTILLALKLQRYSFNQIIIINYSVYLFNQQIIIQNQFKLLSYRIISGIKWIYSNQQFQFYTQKHIQTVIFFIAPTTSLSLLIPILLFFLLKLNDRRSIWCIKKYGIIYCDFKQNAYFWEIIRIYTKHIIIFLLYFFNYLDKSILILFLLIKIYLHKYVRPYPLNNINQVEKNAYRLTVFQLIMIFQLKRQLPTLTLTVTIILNIYFAHKIINLLVRCFQRQYKNLIQIIINWLKQKFPNRFQRLQIQDSQLIQQKFRKAGDKILNKISKHHTLQLIPIERNKLITINTEIELQPLENIRPASEQNQGQ